MTFFRKIREILGSCILTVAASQGTGVRLLVGTLVGTAATRTKQENILKAAQIMLVLFCDLRHVIKSDCSNRWQSNDETTKLTKT